MSSVSAGWYKDPADTSTQRYWDGEGWVGKAIPADAVPPDGPPAVEPEPPAPITPAAPSSPAVPGRLEQPDQPVPAHGPPPGWTPQQPPPGWAPQPPPPPGWQPPPGIQPPPGWQQPPAHGLQQPPAGWQQPPGWHPGAQPMHAYPYPYPIAEARPHGMALAGLGRRLTARLIDITAVLLLNVLVNGYFVYLYLQDFMPIVDDYWAQMSAGNTNPVIGEATPRMSTLSIAIVMIATLLWLVYEAPSIGGSGQTLGKRVMGIKVIPLDKAGPIGFGRAFTRWARLGMWTLFWWCCLGMIVQFVYSLSPLFDSRLRQGWHDKAAGTVVVAVPPGASPTVEAANRGDIPGGPR